MKRKILSLILILFIGFSGASLAQNLTLTGTPVSPSCNNGTNGSITMSATGCPGTVTYTSVPALTFTGNVANNVAPGSYTITGNTQASGGTQVVYNTNFASANDWQLNVVTGSEGGSPNPWQSGIIGGGQGTAPASACGPSVSTGLFIRCTGIICDIFGQGGPVYNASSAANNTDRAAHLNTNINTTGLSNITLRFAWRCGGSPAAFANVRYSINGGSTWIDLPQQYHFNTSWQCATVNLPATTENISNLRIGFRWRNTNNSGDQDPPIVITNVSVEGTGGGASACTGSTTVVVTNPDPIVMSVSPNGTQALCSGQSLTLTAQAGFSGYTWSNGMSGQSITVSTPGTYSVTATSANNCNATSEVVTVVEDNSGTTFDLVVTGNTNICGNETVTLAVPAGFTATSWTGTSQTGNSVVINSAGTYTAIATTPGGCNAVSNPVEITAGALPVAGFTYNQIDNYTVVFTNTTQNGVNFFWIFPGNNTTSGVNPSYSFPFENTYPVTLIASNGCGSDTITINVVVIKVSIESIQWDIDLQLMPNPFQQFISLQAQSLKPENTRLQIINTLGQVVHNEQFVMEGKWNKEIHLGFLPAGTYFLRLESAAGTLSRRLIKQ